MFTQIVDSKVKSLKLNLDNYLSQNKKAPTPTQQPIPSIRRPQQPGVPTTLANSHSQGSSQLQSSINSANIARPGQIQIKNLFLQGKSYQKGPLAIKFSAKQKSQTRCKIEFKGVDAQVKILPQKSSVQIGLKKAAKHKFNRQNVQPKWIFIEQLKNQKIILVIMKDLKLIKSLFQGIVPEQHLKFQQGDSKSQEKPEGQKEEGQQQDDIINFLLPTAQQLVQTQKFRKSIRQMKEEQKINIFMDIFRIRRQYDDGVPIDRKKNFKCPIHACQKIYRQISQLKAHMRKHPELIKHGIQLSDYGVFDYGQKALDLVLYLGKVFPGQLKKIIKKMKLKRVQNQQ